MKRLLCLLAVLAMTVCVHAQTVTNLTVVTATTTSAAVATNAPVATTSLSVSPNAPIAITANPDGTLTINPTDLLSFIPAKYRSLILFVLVLIPIIGRMYHAFAAGGGVTSAISSAVLGKNQAVSNEIAQLKVRTGLPQTPAPAPVTPAAAKPAPVVPLTNLPPPAV